MGRALITGVTGQDGLYLAEQLINKGYEVFGLVRGQNNPKRELVEREVPGVKIVTGDLTDLSSLLRALQTSAPDEVYNLGAISFVAYSWENARLTSEVTGLGVLNMLEATRLYSGDDVSKVRFYQASSSEMFGKVQQVPQSEATLLWPRSPYGVAKVFGHYMTINYRESYGMHASSGILFNHESPRRGPEFVTRKISRAVARISLGLQDSVSLGNLEAKRDFTDVRDTVRAYRMVMEKGRPGATYNVCSGEARAISQLLEILLSFSEAPIGVERDPRRQRPSDIPLLVGNNTRLREATGWEPTIPLEKTLRDTLDFWRARAEAGGDMS